MPDNDIIPRVIRPGYRKPAQMACGGQDPADVGDVLRSGFAADLRASGLPALSDLGASLRDSAVFGDVEIWSRAVEGHRRAAGDSAVLRGLSAEGERLLETKGHELPAMTDDAVAKMLVHGGFLRAARSAVFGPAAVTREMLKESGKSVAAVRAYQEECLAKAQIEVVADAALRRPAESIRAPRSTRRASTEDMLHQGLE
jgi:hypothetical protein